MSAPDRQIGDEVPPGFDLGLDRTSAGGINIVLIDPRKKKVYRPLSHRSREQAYRCLCTPIWSAQATLHLGETRLLQVAYPALPSVGALRRRRGGDPAPVQPCAGQSRGFAPTATHPADLARPPEPIEPLTAPQYFQTDDGVDSRRTATLRVDEVLAAADSTTVRWTLRSMSGQRAFLVVPLGPPLVAVAPPDLPVISTNAASGPTLAAANGRAMPARWMTGEYEDRPFLECLCTNLDIWAIGLRSAGGSAQLVTTYPALPRGDQPGRHRVAGHGQPDRSRRDAGTGRIHPGRPARACRGRALDLRREASARRLGDR